MPRFNMATHFLKVKLISNEAKESGSNGKISNNKFHVKFIHQIKDFFLFPGYSVQGKHSKYFILTLRMISQSNKEFFFVSRLQCLRKILKVLIFTLKMIPRINHIIFMVQGQSTIRLKAKLLRDKHVICENLDE